jgi:putative endonuclease
MYILECTDCSFYTGSTINLEKRIKEHEEGCGASYTRNRLPVRLLYYEEYDRIDEAFNREKQVQGWSKAKKRALINSRDESLPFLSKCRSDYKKNKQ